MNSTALKRIVLLELFMFFKVGVMSVRSWKPMRIVLRRFCSETRWLARFVSSCLKEMVEGGGEGGGDVVAMVIEECE